MAYRAEIEIVAKGVAKVTQLQKGLNQLANQIDKLNGPGSLSNFNKQLAEATKLLSAAQQGTVEEKRAVDLYATAVNNAASAQSRQNRLIDEEIRKRGLATQELKKYNAAAAAPRTPGGSMAGRYMRPGSAVSTTQFSQPIEPAVASSMLGGQSSQVGERIARIKNAQDVIFKTELANEKLVTDFQLTNDQRVFDEKMRQLKIEEQKLLKINKTRNDADLADFDKRLTTKRQPKRGAKALGKAGAFGLGTGFPLLFGGGAGQVAGGGIGTALAGAFDLAGQAAMGLQIGLSAILGKAEELIIRFREVGNAINSLNMDALAGSFITITEKTRTMVRQLVQAGQAQDAIAVAANETAMQTGVLPEATADIAKITNLLSNAWDEVVGSVSGLVSLLAAPFLTALTLILKGVSGAVKGVNFVLSGVGLILKKVVELVGKVPLLKPILDLIKDRTKGIFEEEEKALAAVKEKTALLEREYQSTAKLYEIEKQRTAGKTAGEQLINEKLNKRKALDALALETQAKIKAFKEEHGHLNTTELAYGERRIVQEAALQEKMLLHTSGLKTQELTLQQIQERNNEIKATLDNQVQIYELQAQSAQKVFEVTQARAQAEQSGLTLQESRLTQQLKRIQQVNGSYNQQKAILNKIAKNRREQAKLEFEVAQQTIEQMVAQAELEREMLRLRVEGIKLKASELDLQAQLLKLRAEEVGLTKEMQERIKILNAQKDNQLKIAQATSAAADKSLASTKEIAKFQGISAKSLLTGKLESIELERIEGRRAVTSAAIAKSNQQTAQAMQAQSRAQSAAESGAKSGTAGHLDKLLGPKLSGGKPLITVDNDVHERVTSRGSYGDIYQLVNALAEAQASKNRGIMIAAARQKTKDAAVARQKEIDDLNKAEFARRKQRAGQVNQRYAKGGHVSGPQMALIGEAGPEYVVPEKKAAAFATNYLMGARGAGAIPRYAEGGYTGPINIQTGPVMQQGGETYLTMAQFEAGMRNLSESLARNGRSYGSRHYQGVS